MSDVTQTDIDCRNAIYRELTGLADPKGQITYD